MSFGQGGNGIEIRKKFWSSLTVEEKAPRIHAWWTLEKFLRKSDHSTFKLEAWIGPYRSKPSFRLREISPAIGNGGLEAELRLDYPIPAFYKMEKQALKSESKLVKDKRDVDNWNLEWNISRSEVKRLAAYVISRRFSKDIKRAKSPKTPRDFLLKHILNPHADRERKREIFNPSTVAARSISMRSTTTEKYISMSAIGFTHTSFSIYSPNYKKDKLGMLFRSSTPRTIWFGKKRPKRTFITVFVGYNGVVVTEDNSGMSSSVRLTERDFSRFMGMVANWQSAKK